MTKSILESILDPEQLSVCFQPIFSISGGIRRVDSVEALIRGPRGTNFTRADILFDYVRRKKAELPVDRTCFTAICAAAAELPVDLRINVNVHASTLKTGSGFVDFFRSHVQRRSLAPERFTLEIVEQGPACSVEELTESIHDLRDCGVRIALDDVGLGQSNYRMIVDCDPDYLKVDAYFIRNLSVDSKRLAVVESLVTLGEALQSSLVAEGATSNEDLATLTKMGVDLFQANILCPAMPIGELVKTGHLGISRAMAATAGASASTAQKIESQRMHMSIVAGHTFYT